MKKTKTTIRRLNNGKIIISEEIKQKIKTTVEVPSTLITTRDKDTEDEFYKFQLQVDNIMKIDLSDYNGSLKSCSLRRPLFGSLTEAEICSQKYNYYKQIRRILNNKRNELNIAREEIIGQLLEKSVDKYFTVTLLARCFLYLETVYKDKYKEINKTYKMYANEALHYKRKLETLYNK